MALDPSNSSSLEQLALKGLMGLYPWIEPTTVIVSRRRDLGLRHFQLSHEADVDTEGAEIQLYSVHGIYRYISSLKVSVQLCPLLSIIYTDRQTDL